MDSDRFACLSMGNEVAKNSPAAAVIAEEERLFGQAEARAEDLPPLIEQMTRLAALKARLGGGKSLPVDITSPYFAHMRLKEAGKSRDVMIGKRGFIDRQ